MWTMKLLAAGSQLRLTLPEKKKFFLGPSLSSEEGREYGTPATLLMSKMATVAPSLASLSTVALPIPVTVKLHANSRVSSHLLHCNMQQKAGVDRVCVRNSECWKPSYIMDMQNSDSPV